MGFNADKVTDVRLPLSTPGESKDVPTSLQIDGQRLNDTLHESCQYGMQHRYGQLSTETGMARLALSDEDKSVRLWFIEQVKSLGCKVTIDQMGNIFAVRPGKNSTAPPIMMGSHLDTQPTGGRYDGILGVLAGLEVLRTLHDHNYTTEGNIGVVDWTNEEGARFPMIGIASGVWAGVHSLETGWTCQEIKANKDGRRHSVKEELERIGFLGQTPASFEANPMAAHFELHIEQGPILENEGRKIGVVTGAQAYKWFQIRVRGRDSHAGTTPFNARQDAVLAAAKMIVESNQIARDRAGLVTTGNVNVEPGSMNTTAHTVQFTMDMRHPSDGMLSEIEDTCRRRFAEIAKTHSEKGVTVEWTQLTDSPAVTFHDDCISAVQGATEEVCAALPKTSEMDSLWMPMVSGAGHDSCYTNRMCPTGMIFTPTKDGLSHTPTEYCSPEECALGAQVLLGAVLRYDKMRAEKGLL